jgi:hypothetical protein
MSALAAPFHRAIAAVEHFETWRTSLITDHPGHSGVRL